jgi:hypothetical protein
MTRSRQRKRVALKEPANVSALCIYTHSILEAVEGNTWLSNPVPSLAIIKAALADVEKLMVDAHLGGPGLREKRDAARDVLVIHLQFLRAYVEWVAGLNPEHAATIIKSSRFDVAVRTIPDKPWFEVKPGRVSGSVVIVLRAVAKTASYEAEYSPDQGKTWIVAGLRLQTTRTIADLEPGKTYLFRVRPVTRRGGPGDWYTPIAFIVC